MSDIGKWRQELGLGQYVPRHPGRGIGAGVQRHQADPIPVFTTPNQTQTQTQIQI